MQTNQDDIPLKDIFQKVLEWYKYFLSKWKLIAVVVIIGAVTGFIYSTFSKNVYNAKLTFALEEKGSGGNGIGALASQFGFNLGGSDGGAFSGDNIIELLKSRYLIEKTLLTKVNFNGQQDLLVNRYISYKKKNETWSKNPKVIAITFADGDREKFSLEQDSLLGTIYKSISGGMLSVSKVDKKLSIVSVTLKAENEIFAKLFCESLVKNVTDFYVETKTAKSRGNVALLEHRVDSVRLELDQAMYGRARLSDQNLGLVSQQAAVPKMKQELRVQMLGTMYGELIKNLEFSKLALMREEPLIQVIDGPILPLDKSRLGKTTGILTGSFVLGLFCMIYLTLRKILKDVMSSTESAN